MCKKRSIHGFLGTSWVLITMGLGNIWADLYERPEKIGQQKHFWRNSRQYYNLYVYFLVRSIPHTIPGAALCVPRMYAYYTELRVALCRVQNISGVLLETSWDRSSRTSLSRAFSGYSSRKYFRWWHQGTRVDPTQP